MPIRDLSVLLSSMRPVLNDGAYIFATVETAPHDAIATMRESEGLSVVLPEARARALGIEVDLRFAWITLTVHSALEAVGLTAAVSRALTDAGIPCNVIAGMHHDHLFVPLDTADQALQALNELSMSVDRYPGR